MRSTRASSHAAQDMLSIARLICSDDGKALLAQFAGEHDKLAAKAEELRDREAVIVANEAKIAAGLADHATRESGLSAREAEHAEKAKSVDAALAAAEAVQARLEEVERREAALVGRSDALDKREADIKADAARRSAELYEEQKKLDARDAELKAKVARVSAAMSA